MVIGFKKQFVGPIKAGTKIHTIREDKHDRWKPGVLMHMATGVRTKQYNQFAIKECKSVQTIEIRWKHNGKHSYVYVTIDGKRQPGVLHSLAPNDGFFSTDGFLVWFGEDFKGKIIHWTNFRY